MPTKDSEGSMYKPKCQSVKPQASKDIAYTHCEKDSGHPGDHYGNDTHNHLLTSSNIEMASWESQELGAYPVVSHSPTGTCARCSGSDGHE